MDEDVDLWIAVINQALWDATLGVSEHAGSNRKKQYVLPKGASNYFYERDIREGREFIRGKNGSLHDICQALGADYEEIRLCLLRRYNECQKIIPKKYQEKLELYPHNKLCL